MDQVIPNPPQSVQAVPHESLPPTPPVQIKKPINPLVFISLGVLILAAGAGGYYLTTKTTKPTSVACTMEAKICPDGSAVGRTGPNCEFTPCTTIDPHPLNKWKTYTNTDLGISIDYPTNLTIVKDEDRRVLLPTPYIGHTLLIADSIKPTEATISIQLNIENTLQYEVPWSNGKIITLTKDNFDTFHTVGPEKVTKTEIYGHYALKSQDLTNGLHTMVSILNTDRVIRINIDTKDVNQTDLQNQILSTFKLLEEKNCTKNTALGITINPNTNWSCYASVDDTGMGSISLKSDIFDVTLSDGGRGPYCGDGPDPENLCKTRSLVLSDKFTFTIFSMNGEDKEIFGGLGKTPRNTNGWISIKYKNMETLPLTSFQKEELLTLLNSIEFTK